MKLFLLALQFLTRVPVKVRGTVEVEDMARSMAFFPLIGLFLGGAAAALHTLMSRFLAFHVCDLFVLAFLIIITGNMHLDGLMDTADGLFSGKSRERILEIMKDSRVGSHGVIAGSMVLLLKFVLLGQIPPGMRAISLVVMPVLGRWSQVYGAKVYPYARVGGGTGAFTDYVGNLQLLWATLSTILTVLLIVGYKGIFLLGVVLLGTALLGWYIYKKIGGVTGDTLGAVTECVEVLVLFTLQFLF